MHRVELKGRKTVSFYAGFITVPNAPCGVESEVEDASHVLISVFLMSRLELKM
jgi:hypothetical protein